MSSGDAHSDRQTLGRALVALRIQSGLSQKQLAALAASDHTYLSRLEHGRIDVGWSTLLRLLRALDVDLSRFVVAVIEAEAGGEPGRRRIDQQRLPRD